MNHKHKLDLFSVCVRDL